MFSRFFNLWQSVPTKNAENSFDQLPNEMITAIFEFLERDELLAAKYSTKRFKSEADYQLLQLRKEAILFFDKYLAKLPDTYFLTEQDAKNALRHIANLTHWLDEPQMSTETKQAFVAVLMFMLQDCLFFLTTQEIYEHKVNKGETMDEASRFLGPLGPNGIEDKIEPLDSQDIIDLYHRYQHYLQFLKLTPPSAEDQNIINKRLPDLKIELDTLYQSKEYNYLDCISHFTYNFFFRDLVQTHDAYQHSIEHCLDKLHQQFYKHFPDTNLSVKLR